MENRLYTTNSFFYDISSKRLNDNPSVGISSRIFPLFYSSVSISILIISRVLIAGIIRVVSTTPIRIRADSLVELK